MFTNILGLSYAKSKLKLSTANFSIIPRASPLVFYIKNNKRLIRLKLARIKTIEKWSQILGHAMENVNIKMRQCDMMRWIIIHGLNRLGNNTNFLWLIFLSQIHWLFFASFGETFVNICQLRIGKFICSSLANIGHSSLISYYISHRSDQYHLYYPPPNFLFVQGNFYKRFWLHFTVFESLSYACQN